MNDNTQDIPVCDDELVEFDVPTEFGPLPTPVTAEQPAEEASVAAEPATVEVRRRAGVAALVGVLAGAVATAYLARAVDTGAALDWAVCALMALVAVTHLAALLDARTPLLVADDLGVRLRLGRSWAGLTWGSLRRVQVTGRAGLRDGRIVLVPRNAERVEAEADAGARRSLRLARRLYGAPFTVPLSLATRVVGTDDVEAALRALAEGRTDVTDAWPEDPDTDEHVDVHAEAPEDDLEPSTPAVLRWTHPGPVIAHGIGVVAARLRSRPDVDAPGTTEAVPAPIDASSTPSPLRHLVTSRRSEVTTSLVAGANALKPDLDEDVTRRALPEELELRRPGGVDVEDWVAPVAIPGDALETVVIDDLAIEPAVEPVIGPEFAAARTRLGLSVDQVAERTRIRPHVIESIEVDDFVPCGGDFYARGHIRTLARILGVDAAPLLASYDERYADAPVNPRRVFEAELAHSGGIRATRGGPNWSVLVAAVMALVLAWSIARLVMDGPVGPSDAIVLNGSGGPNHQGAPVAPAVPVVISAPGSGARVIVRDGAGAVVFSGDLAFGGSKTLSVSPPVRVQATDGSVTVSVDGEDHGPLGATGSPGSGTFVVR
ncbi:MAG TPA: helix-turn-helix domain-containing protein [Nocardioides sp.]|nr:helix-turn-helix domain-containing protein [Nocardioides sp.]